MSLAAAADNQNDDNNLNNMSNSHNINRSDSNIS